MKVVCAPDSYKESLGAKEVADALAAGVRAADPAIEVDRCPIADGGEGSLDVILAATGGTLHRATVTGPRPGTTVEARFGVTPDGRTGIVELAQACGLARVPPGDRDPTGTTTYGVGELIAACAAAGCATAVIALGGSATCDGAAGLAQALGGRFLDDAGRAIEAPLTGGDLERVAAIEPPAVAIALVAACDVTNPLLGPNGAAAIYGPQKGATRAQVVELERALANLAHRAGGDATTAGFGAAGGAGFGLATLCGATIGRGIDVVLDLVGFEARCAGAALILTGEGRLDAQSLAGKACLGVARVASRRGVPTAAVVGSTGPGAERCIDAATPGLLAECVSLADRYGRERALRETAALVRAAAESLVREWTARAGGAR